MNKSLLDHILRIRLPITLFVVIASFTITYFVSRAERDGVGYSPVQPINFSHKLHAGLMKIDCQYCHTGVEKSRHAMVPPLNTCMNCHGSRTEFCVKCHDYAAVKQPKCWDCHNDNTAIKGK